MLRKQDVRSSVPLAQRVPGGIQDLYRQLQRSQAQLVGPDGTRQNLPVSLGDFLAQLNAGLTAGQSVAIVQSSAHLTTAEAARTLGVSRQFLVNLLERGDIPFYKVGAHRRVYACDLLAYKARRDQSRRRILDDLTRAEAGDGLYDREAPDD